MYKVAILCLFGFVGYLIYKKSKYYDMYNTEHELFSAYMKDHGKKLTFDEWIKTANDKDLDSVIKYTYPKYQKILKNQGIELPELGD